MDRHSDYLDAAAELTDKHREFTVKKICAAAAQIDTSNASLMCWQCGEITGRERRFCNKQCASLWSAANER